MILCRSHSRSERATIRVRKIGDADRPRNGRGSLMPFASRRTPTRISHLVGKSNRNILAIPVSSDLRTAFRAQIPVGRSMAQRLVPLGNVAVLLVSCPASWSDTDQTSHQTSIAVGLSRTSRDQPHAPPNLKGDTDRSAPKTCRGKSKHRGELCKYR
jgi:hypothetical protein